MLGLVAPLAIAIALDLHQVPAAGELPLVGADGLWGAGVVNPALALERLVQVPEGDVVDAGAQWRQVLLPQGLRHAGKFAVEAGVGQGDVVHWGQGRNLLPELLEQPRQRGTEVGQAKDAGFTDLDVGGRDRARPQEAQRALLDVHVEVVQVAQVVEDRQPRVALRAPAAVVVAGDGDDRYAGIAQLLRAP